ncbi:MAG: pirin family protein [Gammaproteobacteria bacterium]|nr:MAG: pirin family protein [Gammaproteobacteria bacterium]
MSARPDGVTAVSGRDVSRVVEGRDTSDGAGVSLRRYIATPELNMLDPFLLLDSFRSDNPDDYIAGFPPHPHRGFETVTYLLAGRMRHRDSTGREGVIHAGGVQWMTAGSGIEHSEMPEQEQGLLDGFQLWVNLPAANKMQPPCYQEFEPEQIPVEVRDNHVRLRVIAGITSHGTKGAVSNIAAAPLYLDVSLPANASFVEPVADGHNGFIYVIDGTIEVMGKTSRQLHAQTLGVLSQGDHVALKAKETSRFLLIAGKPFREPVARYGPFVMNTQEEIQQAFIDYREGRFGYVAEPVT